VLSVRTEWARLELAVVISTESYLLIQESQRAPFNVRVPVVLQPFDETECRELNQRYRSVLSDEQAEWLRQELMSGHPFLTQLAYYLMRFGALSLDDLIRDADRLDGHFGEHLQLLLVKLRENRNQDLLAALRQVIHDGTSPNDDTLVRLLGAGLIRREGDRLVPANGLYARFFGNL
jgi:hypothetical protein